MSRLRQSQVYLACRFVTTKKYLIFIFYSTHMLSLHDQKGTLYVVVVSVLDLITATTVLKN
jgi:hypothetical protein